MTAMANADLSPTMEALEQEPSSGMVLVMFNQIMYLLALKAFQLVPWPTRIQGTKGLAPFLASVKLLRICLQTILPDI